MNFSDKNKEKEEAQENNDIEIIIGDNSNLDISDVGSYMNELRRKEPKKKKNDIVIPKTKK